MKALRFKRNIPRYAAAKIAGNIMPGSGASFGPIDLIQEENSESPKLIYQRSYLYHQLT